MINSLDVHEATRGEIAEIRLLLEEYWKSLGFARDTFGFGRELEALSGDYSGPHGRLGLAVLNGEPVGCIALRQITPLAGEMKHLYVRSSARRNGVASCLLRWLIEEARVQGYTHLQADTLPNMHDALRLYAKFGFMPIPPYSLHPTPKAIYLELDLGVSADS